MERAPQKNLVLILARELASNVATAVFLIDVDGTLVYFNEPGEAVLGRPFSETGELSAGEWGAEWNPRRSAGEPYPLDRMPIITALRDRRPAHDAMRITGSDGVEREIAVTAVPLFARSDELVGAMAVFWSVDR